MSGYEEKMIDGIMCWRSSTKYGFKPMTLKEVSYLYDNLKKELRDFAERHVDLAKIDKDEA